MASWLVAALTVAALTVAALTVAALALIFYALARSRRDCAGENKRESGESEGGGWFFQGRRGRGGGEGDDAEGSGPVLPSRPLRNALRNAAHSGDMATVRDILERSSRRFQGFQHWGQLTCQDLREAFQRAWRRGHRTLAHYLHRRRLTHGCAYEQPHHHPPRHAYLHYTHPPFLHPLRPAYSPSLGRRHRRASTHTTPFRRYRRWRRRHPLRHA